MYMKVHFFSQIFTFFSIWSVMRVYDTAIVVCLNKFHVWESSGSWDMDQNALGQSDCQSFQSVTGL